MYNRDCNLSLNCWERNYIVYVYQRLQSQFILLRKELYSLCIQRLQSQFKLLKKELYSFWHKLKLYYCETWCCKPDAVNTRAAIVRFNFRAGSNFPVPVCTVLHGNWVKKADNQQDYPVQQDCAVRLYASYRLNLLLLKRQRCVCMSASQKQNAL